QSPVPQPSSMPAYPGGPAQNRTGQPSPLQPPIPRPYPAPQQANHYPMAYQQAPRPAQYRPPQQPTYQAPRNKAPRQPQSYAPNAPAKRTGLGCLSKLAILVIVLAIAVAVGVTVGRQLAKRHPTAGFGNGNRSSSSVSQTRMPVGFARQPS
ncbi:hypothetical protein KGA66_22415, partial [Actinocrinis puniceicyclus]|nr:hypothetical protein [Actinocrinis puniceicyclus]